MDLDVSNHPQRKSVSQVRKPIGGSIKMTLYAFDKWLREYEVDHSKGAIYDFLQEQLDRFGFQLKVGKNIFVVSYLDRSLPATNRKIQVGNFESLKFDSQLIKGAR